MSVLPGQYTAGVLPVQLFVPLTLTVPLTATSTVAALTHPAGIQAKDLIVLWDCAANNIGATVSATPGGYTQILDIAGAGNNSARGIASYKIAAGTQGRTGVGGMNGGVFNNKQLFVLRVNRPILTLTRAGIVRSALDSGAPPSQNILASAGSPTLIVFGGYGSKGGNTASRTFSTTADQTV